tara:strand:+ start:387 stop:521 length:135 start_codon:yes stop_codon:yes gene_type:complete
MEGSALGAAITPGQRSSFKKMDLVQEDGEISEDASPLLRPLGTK